jgi:cardiolipin synthase
MMMRENIYTVPNMLSFSRLLLSPFCGYLIVQQDYTSAMAVFAVAGVTDMVRCDVIAFNFY